MSQLNTSLRDFGQLREGKFGLYPSGNKVTAQSEILFARLDMKEVAKREEEVAEAQNAGAAKNAVGNTAAKAAENTPKKTAGQEKPGKETTGNSGAGGESDAGVIDVELKPEITYDDFARLQFQVGEIIACEAVPKSKKLLCSQVRIGSQVKQIVSGIKAHYSPEEMVGKKVMVLVNLKPATLAGVVSEGMLLCAEDAQGRLALVSPEKDMPAGAEIC